MQHNFYALIPALALTWLIAGATANTAMAAEQSSKVRAVVELFTSQGCSSCPPADKLLKTFVERPDVMALTLPVDYWDYLGWKDTFASPRYSERQRAYARSRGDGAVYTPQVVINGRGHAVGSKERQINKSIMAFEKLAPLDVPVSISSKKGVMIIELGGAPEGLKIKSATVWLAAVQKTGVVKIARGENRGRKLNYFNIVRDLAPVGMWNGKADRLELDLKSLSWTKMDACAVLVQEGIGGPILGAAWLDG
ncbi:MAG: DUF1223 domain-containing protein [Alphaproteobacteria bacterium]|nr:DUF1223 domain-containing protein [Alphaproteobacteria bacterium]